MCEVTEQLRDQLWEEAFAVEGYDSELYRHDACGAWMVKEKYGDRSSAFGWDVDYIFPKKILEERGVLKEEIENPTNLRALNWRNKDSKGDDYPVYHAKVVAKEGRNVEEDRELSVSEEKQRELRQLYGKYFPQ